MTVCVGKDAMLMTHVNNVTLTIGYCIKTVTDKKRRYFVKEVLQERLD